MKKTWKKLTALLLAFVMMIPVIPVQAQVMEWPEQPLQVQLPKTIYLSTHPKAQETKYIGYVSGAKKVTVKAKGSAISVEKSGNSSFLSISAKIKKPGTAYIYTKVNNKKTYKTRVIVKKYTNPISSINIGKTRISGKKYNKDTYSYLSYKKFANKKHRIKVKARSGWKVKSAEYVQKDWMKTEIIKNGVVTVKGGPGFEILLIMQNKKTKMEQFIHVRFV